MKRVYTTDNYMLAGQVKGLLEANEIQCFMKNDSLTGGIGELPPIECWPEIWIQDDDDATLADDIIHSYLSSHSKNNNNWQCPCGEHIEGQFSQCWKCGYIH